MSSFNFNNNNIVSCNNISQINNTIVPNNNIIVANHDNVPRSFPSMCNDDGHGAIKRKYFESSFQAHTGYQHPTKIPKLPIIHQNNSMDTLLLAANKIELGGENVDLDKEMFDILKRLTSLISSRIQIVEQNVLANNSYKENKNLGILNELIINVQDVIKKRMNILNNSGSSNKIYLPLPVFVPLPSNLRSSSIIKPINIDPFHKNYTFNSKKTENNNNIIPNNLIYNNSINNKVSNKKTIQNHLKKSQNKKFTMNLVNHTETNNINNIPKTLTSDISSSGQKSLPTISFITNSHTSSHPVSPVSMSSGTPSASSNDTAQINLNNAVLARNTAIKPFTDKNVANTRPIIIKNEVQKIGNLVKSSSKISTKSNEALRSPENVLKNEVKKQLTQNTNLFGNINVNNKLNNINNKPNIQSSSIATTHIMNTFTIKKCFHCGSTDTPEWRTGPYGKNNLCNACGLFYRKVVKKFGVPNAKLLMKYRREICCENRRVPAFISVPSDFLTSSSSS